MSTYRQSCCSAELCVYGVGRIVGLLEPLDLVPLAQKALEQTPHALDGRLGQFESLPLEKEIGDF